ncbi:hypothetical protein [Mesobacillus foraminis]|uniref:hypothetical protein n=1 Tax=Mesobacillus foraminis TaxID=279826 RepID=UPI0013CF0D47|nr:hypothetical protein [Mesobacillus foraminis]
MNVIIFITVLFLFRLYYLPQKKEELSLRRLLNATATSAAGTCASLVVSAGCSYFLSV